MFDIGWTEMALIAVVAVVVIGPKELPKVMREMGLWVSRARNMSRVFMMQLEEMSRQAGIEDVRKEAEKLRQLDPAREIEKAVDPDGVIARQADDLAKIGSPLEPPRPPSAVEPGASGETAASEAPLPAIEPLPAEPAKPVTPEETKSAAPGEVKP